MREIHPLFRGDCALLLADGRRIKLSRSRRKDFEAHVGDKVNQAVGVARGIRAVIASLIGTESGQSAAPAAGSI